MVNTAPETLLKEYEVANDVLLGSKARFFQVEALVLTLVWGGFALFATQTSPGSAEHILVVSAAAAGASGFSIYWIITSNRMRFEEIVIEDRLREIEEKLGLYLHTDVWLSVRHTPLDRISDELAEPEKERQQVLEARVKPSRLVAALGRSAPFPLGSLIGVGGILIWSALVVRAIFVHVGWL